MALNKKQRFSRLAEMGCCICIRNGDGPTPPHIHHLTGAGMALKETWKRTIPLCPYHHQQGPFGEAVHNGTKTFETKHGTQEELLEWVNDRLAIKQMF